LNAPIGLLAKLPRVYLMCGEADPLVDDCIMFAGKIRAARQDEDDWKVEEDGESECGGVKLKILKGMSHGFLMMNSLMKESREATRCCSVWFDEAFGQRKLQHDLDHFSVDERHVMHRRTQSVLVDL